MRCQEAERRVDRCSGVALGDLEPELRQHLLECADCRAYWQAAQALARDLRADAQLPESDGLSLRQTRHAVETAIDSRNWRRRLMAKIETQLETRPALMTSVGIIVLALLFAVLVPLPYQQQVGYGVSLAGVISEDDNSPQLLEAAFAAMGHEEVEVAAEGEGKTRDLVIRNLPDSTYARAAYEAAVALYGSREKWRGEIKRRYAEAKATFASQLLQRRQVEPRDDVHLRFVKGGLEIEGDKVSDKLRDFSLTDAEVEAEIDRIFARHGVSREDIDFSVKTEPDKKLRTLTLEKLPRAATPEEEGPDLIFDVDGQDVYARARKGEITLKPDLAVHISIPDKDSPDSNVTLRIHLKNWGD